MRLMPHLSFNGQCEAAFAVYAACFGGEIAFLLHYRDSGSIYPPELADKVFHATLKVGDQVLTGVDVASDRYEKPQGFSVQMNLSDPAKAQAIFDALREGGLVQFPLGKTTWAGAYAVLTDRFGIPWEVNCGTF